jgi:hypothetical protein
MSNLLAALTLSTNLATLVEIARASSGLLLSLGMLSAIGIYGWFNLVIPFHQNIPVKPIFANESNKLVPSPPPKFLEKLPESAKSKPIAIKADVLFEAKVNSSIGLVLRAEPVAGGKMSGGAEFNARVEVLKETPDRAWVFIRQPVTKEQGWVRSGNLTRS